MSEERKLATIRIIDDIQPIPGADKIVVATVGGWKVIVQKDEYKVGDLAVYLEVDSWVPHDLAPFLSKNGTPKEYNGVRGNRLRTIKMKGQLSQGLVLPAKVLSPLNVGPDDSFDCPEGYDVTNILGIQKWEKPLPAELQGTAKGYFPNFIRKTDQERIQNLTKRFEEWTVDGSMWEVTEKLDGSSMTVYVRNYYADDEADPVLEKGVCSRNLELDFNEENTFWKTALKQDLFNKLVKSGRNLALQGELIGPGIQGNSYKFETHKFFVFDIFDIDKQEYLLPIERQMFCIENDIDLVPIWSSPVHFFKTSVEEILKVADGTSAFGSEIKREGVVFKHLMQHDVSFKAISNDWLLENE